MGNVQCQVDLPAASLELLADAFQSGASDLKLTRDLTLVAPGLLSQPEGASVVLRGTNNVGSGRHNELQIPHDSVNGTHAIIDDCVLVDLSGGKVTVAGPKGPRVPRELSQLPSWTLQRYDRVSFGDIECTVLMPEDIAERKRAPSETSTAETSDSTAIVYET